MIYTRGCAGTEVKIARQIASSIVYTELPTGDFIQNFLSVQRSQGKAARGRVVTTRYCLRLE